VTEQERGLPVGVVLAVAAAVELVLQSLRAFFPLGYDLVGSLGFVVTPVVLLPVFLAPLLVVPLRRLLGPRLVVISAGTLVVARLALQTEPSLATAVVAVVAGLVAVTVALPVLAGQRFGPDAVAAGTLVALGLDVALRAWRATDDVVWSSGWSAWLDPSLWVPIVLLAATTPALARMSSTEQAAPVWTWFVLLMPQLLLWSSLAFVGSSGDAALSVTTTVLLASVAAAMALLAWPTARVAWPVPGAIVLGAAVAMPWATGISVLVLASAATVATPLLVREAAARAAQRPYSSGRHATAATAGALAMFVLLLLYPLHYEIALPIDNAWLPGLAVVLGCLPLLRRPRSSVATEFAAPSRLHRPAVAFVAVGSVVLGVAVHLGMVGGSPLPGPDDDLRAGEPRSGELRVATYNLGMGQDAQSGALAFREVAAVLATLDADVVAVQEVARGWPLVSMSDLGAWLAAHTDWTIAYAPAADRQFGNALLSRVPLVDVTTIDLGQGGGAQRRSAIRADLPDGVRVYGMHLQARNNAPAERTRLAQMNLVLDDWDGRDRTVLAGDLNPRNTYADDTETPPTLIDNLEVFTEAGLVTSQPTDRCTEPTSNDNCSDYVFTSDDMGALAPAEVIGVDVTDHRPVLARLAPVAAVG
jgi:endonuclease/exonuclease/phosphatase family metal-dependent hydrolase